MTLPPHQRNDLQHVPFVHLQSTLEHIFNRHGTSAEVASVLAHNCASAERDGAHSHGVFRIPGYLSTLASGWVDGRAVPHVEDVAPGYLAVDACNGFAQPAYRAAYPALVAKARTNGVALLAIRNSHHFAALWPDVEPLANDGLVALALVNSMACVVPSGGTTALFGTNPIAFAWPRIDAAGAPRPPFVFDFATSVVARGEIELHRRAGKPVPEDWGYDAAGNPTTDAAAVLDGAMRTFGGHKGSALAAMVELLAGPLIGDMTSAESIAADAGRGGSPIGGELILALDPERFLGADLEDRFAAAEAMFHTIEAQGARLPSSRRYAARARSLVEGVTIPGQLYADILKIA